MKKRLIFLAILLVALLALTGCADKVKDIHGTEQTIHYGFVKIRELNGNGDTAIACDPSTMICYYYYQYLYAFSISPYYIIGENGTPEIAVYGVNYF